MVYTFTPAYIPDFIFNFESLGLRLTLQCVKSGLVKSGLKLEEEQDLGTLVVIGRPSAIFVQGVIYGGRE